MILRTIQREDEQANDIDGNLEDQLLQYQHHSHWVA